MSLTVKNAEEGIVGVVVVIVVAAVIDLVVSNTADGREVEVRHVDIRYDVVDAGEVFRDGLELRRCGDVASPDAARRAVVVGGESRGGRLVVGVVGRAVPAHEEGVGVQRRAGHDRDARARRGKSGMGDRRTARPRGEHAEAAVIERPGEVRRGLSFCHRPDSAQVVAGPRFGGKARSERDVDGLRPRRPLHIHAWHVDECAVHERDGVDGLCKAVVLVETGSRRAAEPDVRNCGAGSRRVKRPRDACGDAVTGICADLGSRIHVAHHRVVVGYRDRRGDARASIGTINGAGRDDLAHEDPSPVAIAGGEAVREARGDAARRRRVNVAERRAAGDFAASQRDASEETSRAGARLHRPRHRAVHDGDGAADDVARDAVVFDGLADIAVDRAEIDVHGAVRDESVFLYRKRETGDERPAVRRGDVHREVAQLRTGLDTPEERRARLRNSSARLVVEAEAGDCVPAPEEAALKIAEERFVHDFRERAGKVDVARDDVRHSRVAGNCQQFLGRADLLRERGGDRADVASGVGRLGGIRFAVAYADPVRKFIAVRRHGADLVDGVFLVRRERRLVVDENRSFAGHDDCMGPVAAGLSRRRGDIRRDVVLEERPSVVYRGFVVDE